MTISPTASSTRPCRRQPRQCGFTLIEVATVLLVLSVIAIYTLPASTGNFERRAIDREASRLQLLMEAATQRRITEGAWPTSVEALVPTYIPNWWERLNAWGNPYQLRVETPSGRLIITSITDSAPIARQLNSRLPNARAENRRIELWLPSPGLESIHDQFILRDGSRSMTGDLDLGGNNLNNVEAVAARVITISDELHYDPGGG